MLGDKGNAAYRSKFREWKPQLGLKESRQIKRRSAPSYYYYYKLNNKIKHNLITTLKVLMKLQTCNLNNMNTKYNLFSNFVIITFIKQL